MNAEGADEVNTDDAVAASGSVPAIKVTKAAGPGVADVRGSSGG